MDIHIVWWANKLKEIDVQYMSFLTDPDSFTKLLIILLCCLASFYTSVYQFLPMNSVTEICFFFKLCLPDSHMFINVLHWTVRLCYYGFLVNEGIGLILVIQTFDPSTCSVLYNKDVYPTSSILWSTTFPFNIFKSH